MNLNFSPLSPPFAKHYTDKILVLDAGQVAEFDSPANLLDTPGSRFQSMVNETGEQNAALLYALAAKKQIELDG
jgi:ABC-type proline/glycine betaine transport system ATPase subunit